MRYNMTQGDKMNYLYSSLFLFFEYSNSGLFLLNGNIIAHENEAAKRIFRSESCFRSLLDVMDKNLAEKILYGIKAGSVVREHNVKIGITNTDISAVRTVGSDAIVLIHPLDDSERVAQELTLAMQMIADTTVSMSDSIATLGVALDALTGVEDEKIKSYVSTAINENLKLEKSIRIIREVSSNSRKSRENCNVKNVVKTVKRILDGIFDKSRLDFRIEEDGEICTAACAGKELESVIYAVVSNALKNKNAAKISLNVCNEPAGISLKFSGKGFDYDVSSVDGRRAARIISARGGTLKSNDALCITLPHGDASLCIETPRIKRLDIKNALVELSEIITPLELAASQKIDNRYRT